MTTYAPTSADMSSIEAQNYLLQLIPNLESSLKTKLKDLIITKVHSVTLGPIKGYSLFGPGFIDAPTETDSVYADGFTGEEYPVGYQQGPGFPELETLIEGVTLPSSSAGSDTLTPKFVEALSASETRDVDYHFEDYEVITNEYPVASVKGHRGSLKLKMVDRVDLTLGKKQLFSPLAADRQDVPPTKGHDGNLVAVILDGNYKRTPRWFVVSHQFLRFWTLLMFGEQDPRFTKHSIKPSGLYDPNMLRNWFGRSTNLTTHGYRKWSLGYIQHGFTSPCEEREERYWRNREEWSARAHCHTYLALTWMLKYRELPCATNLPHGRRCTKASPQGETVTPPLLAWDLPKHFIRNIAQTCIGRSSAVTVASNLVDEFVRSQQKHETPYVEGEDVTDKWFSLKWIEDLSEAKGEGVCVA